MNEPKRRGRPPKAKQEASVVLTPERAAEPSQMVGGFKASALATVEHAKHLAAQAYAIRVWNGQSTDVPRKERIERVKRALEGQNLPFEGVELP